MGSKNRFLSEEAIRLGGAFLEIKKGTQSMKKYALSVVLGALAFVAVGVANADPMVGSKSETVSQPFTVKVGGEWSTNSHSPTLGVAGIDYAFEKSGAGDNPVIPSVYVDDTFKTSGASANVADLGIAIRQDYRQNNGTVTPYIGIGCGGYYASTSSTNHTGFGGKVFGGIELSSSWIVEANYTFREEWNGANLDTYGVEVGLRF